MIRNLVFKCVTLLINQSLNQKSNHPGTCRRWRISWYVKSGNTLLQSRCCDVEGGKINKLKLEKRNGKKMSKECLDPGVFNKLEKHHTFGTGIDTCFKAQEKQKSISRQIFQQKSRRDGNTLVLLFARS